MGFLDVNQESSNHLKSPFFKTANEHYTKIKTWKNSPFNEGLLCISKGQRMEWKAQIKVMVIGFRPFSTQLFVKFLTCQSGMWMKLCSIWFLLRCSIFLSSCWKCLINEKDSQFSPKITRTAINRTIFGISPSFVPFLLNDGWALLQFLSTL